MLDDELRRKRKNDDSNLGDLASADEVDLDELVKTYNQKRKNDRLYLEDADEEAEYTKSKRGDANPGTATNRPHTPEEWEEWGKRMGKNFEHMGEKFGKKAEEWGEKFGKQVDEWARKGGRKFDPKFTRDFGGQVKQFLSHPYESNYHSVEMPASQEERNLAALAHGSIPLIMVGGAFSAGLVTPIFFLLPLVLFFMYRQKSGFVARHALNAFAAMLMGTVGWIALIVGSSIIGVVLTIALALTVVGILAIPFLWLAIVLIILVSLLIPLGTFAFSVIGIFAALGGKTFDYPYVGRWLNRRFPDEAWENV